MSSKTESKISFWMKTIAESIAIITTIVFLLYFPIDAKFATVGEQIKTLDRKVEKSANLELVETKLEQISKDIQRLQDAIERCQEEDAKFRERLYQVWAQ
jgi:cell shape-determining protein MreC